MADGHPTYPQDPQPNEPFEVRLHRQLDRALTELEAIDIGHDTTDAMALATTVASIAEALSYQPAYTPPAVQTRLEIVDHDDLVDLALLLEQLGDWREGNRGPHAPCPVSGGELLRRASALRAAHDRRPAAA